MNTQYTDTQLKQALAKMLPDVLFYEDDWLYWSSRPQGYGIFSARRVCNTELLHLCWLVEEALDKEENFVYAEYLLQELAIDNLLCDWSNELVHQCAHATWQQRTIALAKVKGIEIV